MQDTKKGQNVPSINNWFLLKTCRPHADVCTCSVLSDHRDNTLNDLKSKFDEKLMIIAAKTSDNHSIIALNHAAVWRIHYIFVTKSLITFDNFGLFLSTLTILINWKHIKITPSICGSISAEQTLTLTIFVPMKQPWCLITDMSYENRAAGLLFLYHTGFFHLWSHLSKCSEKIFLLGRGGDFWSDLRDRVYVRWQRDIILGRVVYDAIYSTETVLAKVRGGLKDTEVNVRLRSESTVM